MSSRHLLASCRRQPCGMFSSFLPHHVIYSLSAAVAPVFPPLCRTLATEATLASSTDTASPYTSHPKKSSRPILNTSVILNRSPTLTRTPTVFERAYYAYQARIQRALHNPFPYEFYFKPGSLLEGKFTDEELKRERKAFGRGYSAVNKDDSREVLSAEELKMLGQDDRFTMAQRVHSADVSGDVKSLDRKRTRNLYLLLQAKDDGRDVWRFPQGSVKDGELLHEVSELLLYLKSQLSIVTAGCP
jgi:large subunit ribosomal protein L46